MRLLASAAVLLASFGSVGVCQESRPPAARAKRTRRTVDDTGMRLESIAYDLMYSRMEGDEIAYVFRNPVLRAGDVVVEAERGVLILDAEEYSRQVATSEPSGDPLKPGPALPPTAGRDLYADADLAARTGGPVAKGPVLDLQEVPFRAALRTLFFDGDVHVRRGDRSTVGGAAFLVDVAAGRVLVVDGQLRMDLDNPARPLSLLARARLIRQEASGVTSLTDCEITSCEFAVPHYHVRSRDLELRSVSRQEVFVNSRDNRLTLTDVGSIPLPDLAVYSSDFRYLPLEQAAIGLSRRDGFFVRTLWGREFREFGEQFNEAIGVTGKFKGHWSVNLDWMSRRGPGIGGTVTYETEGVYKGEATAYLLRDHGENSQFLSTVYREDLTYRGMFHTTDRIFASKDTWLDVEISKLSDANFLPEFYPNVFKTEKYWENLVYYRTAGEEASLTSLFKTEFNEFRPNFETGVERGGPPPSETLSFPNVDGRFYPAPVADLPLPAGLFGEAAERPLELVYSGAVFGGYLERYFSQADYQPSFQPAPLDVSNQRALEFTTVHEISAPFSFGVAKLVPFFEFRATGASNSLPSSGVATGLGEDPDSISQLLSTAGARLGSHLEGDAGPFRHTVDTRIEYRNSFDETESGDRFIPFYDTKQPGVQEVLLLDLRNRFSMRDSDTLENLTFADLRVAVPYFVNADRDNGGDSWGPMRVDFRFDLGPRFVVPDFRLRYRSVIDPNDASRLKSDFSVLVSPFGPELDLSVSYRETPNSYEALAVGASYRLDRKWYVDFIEQYDFLAEQSIQTKVALRRYEHDWALEVAFGYDTSDNELSITFSVIPLATGGDRPRDRFVAPTTTFRGFY